MAFDFGAAGGGAAEGLEQVLRRLFMEAQQRQQAELARESMGLQARGQDVAMRGQDITSAGQKAAQSRWDTDRTDRQTREMAEGAEAAAGREQQRQTVARLVAANPQMARLLDARSAGLNVNDPHAVETPEEHAPHIEEEGKRKVAQVGAEAEARGKAEAKYRAPREERTVQIEGPDGRAVWVRESQAVGKPAAQAARAVTGAERQSLAYYNRAKEADELANQTEEKGGLGSQLRQQYAPNMLQTAQQQAYRQAQRAFTEARLRKESGAAIPQGEYDNDARTYFAQPGDSPQVAAQKRQARKTVLEGLKFSSGRAYDEFYGERGATPTKVTITSIQEIK